MEIAISNNTARPGRFFVAIASTMLLIVLAGFAKTFFARSHFGTLDMLVQKPHRRTESRIRFLKR